MVPHPQIAQISCNRATKNSDTVSVSIGSIKLRNPTLLASGILGSTSTSLRRVALAGAGGIVTKSIGVTKSEGYAGPNLVELECGFLNAMGLPNPSYKEFILELREVKGIGIPIIVSVFGSNVAEFVEVAKGVNNEAHALELNLSCPHVKGYGADIGNDAKLVSQIVKKVKQSSKIPVWVKLTAHSDIITIGKKAKDAGADALVAINTLRATVIDIESGYPILGNKVGGLSGTAIKPIALRCVYDLYHLEIPIIGVGGISTWQDAIEFILAGATAVQIGSAVYKDITIFRKISRGIAKYLQRRGKSLTEIRGAAHR
jgi:dihydroorotate dehydrogenase (NAD+) catalytic subunit